jgi:hypothetical protein
LDLQFGLIFQLAISNILITANSQVAKTDIKQHVYTFQRERKVAEPKSNPVF